MPLIFEGIFRCLGPKRHYYKLQITFSVCPLWQLVRWAPFTPRSTCSNFRPLYFTSRWGAVLGRHRFGCGARGGWGQGWAGPGYQGRSVFQLTLNKTHVSQHSSWHWTIGESDSLPADLTLNKIYLGQHTGWHHIKHESVSLAADTLQNMSRSAFQLTQNNT